MAELHLIGTLMQDPDGPERLAALLAEVRPNVVAVEASRVADQRQRAHGDTARAASLAAIQGKGADAATLAFWSRRLARERLHFEAYTTADYAAAQAIPLHFLREDGGAEAADAEAFRRADGQALAALAAHDWRATYRADYARARVDLEAKACLEFLLPVAEQPAYRARDQVMAARVGALLAPGPAGSAGAPGRVAVVCALTHLYFSEARLTIYSQLYEATAQRYIIDGTGAIRDHPIVLPWAPAHTHIGSP